ncbi:MAG: DNA recombination protein RmuC [Candidatus Doudnabacteria bacterium]|nr:DNA recombination protein RmuC [Candidatus Doudnabacteria bacterium]
MNFQILITILIVAGFAAIIYFLRRKPRQDQAVQVMLDWMKSLKESGDLSRKEIQESIAGSNKEINARLTEAARLFSDVQHKVGQMTELGRSMQAVQELLKGPKTRGIFGEDALESLLKQVLPAHNYQMQYRFQSGEAVDCVVKLKEGLVCIDSKFPLENFRAMMKSETDEDRENFRRAFVRDVKKHVETITKKYILTNEGTLDFALMYVPMESVFQEIVNDGELMDYARSRKVHITSPNSFYHYITIIHTALKGAQMNELARQVLNIIAALKQDSEKFATNLGVLNKHVTNAKNTVDVVNEGFRSLAGKIENAYNLQLEEQREVEKLPGGPESDLLIK